MTGKTAGQTNAGWASILAGLVFLVFGVLCGNPPLATAQTAEETVLSAVPGDVQATDEAQPAGQLLGVRFGDHLTKMRFVLEISATPDFDISYADDPMEVLVDFPKLDSDIAEQSKGVRFITGYRLIEREDGGTRISLGLSRAARASQVFYLPETPSSPPRFVLDLNPTTPEDFAALAELSASLDPVAETEPPADEPYDPVAEIIQTTSLVIPEPTDLLPSDIPVEPEAAEEELAEQGSSEQATEPEAELLVAAFPIPERKPAPPPLPLIVLDPGHGGYDPGAVSKSGVREKDITLRAAKILRTLLRGTGRYDVILTREDDRFMALRDRVAVARSSNADMFLSLHADSINDPDVRGASIYTLSEVASDREAAALAARENRAGALSGVALNEQDDDVTVSILIDLAQRQSRAYSTRLADLLIGGISTVQPLVGNNHRQAGFAVLTAPDVPSVLLELGYLSSKADVEALRNERQLTRLMSAIERSIDEYFVWHADRQQ